LVSASAGGTATKSVYEQLGLARVINACGIYTDLGGSCLSPTAWSAATEANRQWASLPELLDRSGEAIAGMLGVEAARVVPGASAALALATGACMTGHDGTRMEQLPDTTGLPARIVMQRGHRYKYTRCALMSGARVAEVGTERGTTEEQFRAGLDEHSACVLHPVHLERQAGTLGLAAVAELAHDAGVPVLVDAAYMSYPIDLMPEYGRQGADLVCFSAKYFWGPNAGGFVYGRRDLVQAIAEIDFTRFESGDHLIFGRAFKLDRATIVATAVALREWLAMDHEARWGSYRERAAKIVDALNLNVPAEVTLGCFTLDERLLPDPVNAVLVRPDPESGHTAATLDAALSAGEPSIRAAVVGDVLSLCLETVLEREDGELIERLHSALNGAR
jgi:L-seryl-tRNA(Ser) seleniumtransferase